LNKLRTLLLSQQERSARYHMALSEVLARRSEAR
jgi:hypothetical protein